MAWLASLSGLVLLATLLSPGVLGAPTVEPPASLDPYHYGTSFIDTPSGANPPGWTITALGFGNATARVDLGGYQTSPLLRVFNAASGGRTTAAIPSGVPRAGTTNLTWAVALNVTKFVTGTSIFNHAIDMSGTTSQGSNTVQRISITSTGLVLMSIGTTGLQTSTGFTVLLNTWYIFRVFVNFVAAPVTADPHGEATLFINSTAVFQGGLPTSPESIEFQNVTTRGHVGGFTGTDYFLKFESGGITGAGGPAHILFDAVQIGLPVPTTDPLETACREFPYETTIRTDVDDDAEVDPRFSALESFRAGVDSRTSSQTTSGFLEVTVTGDPLFALDFDLSLRLGTTAGTRFVNWTVTAIDCGVGAVFGYTGIVDGDPVGGTYFDPNVGHVRPISSSGLILSLDMGTFRPDFGNELLDFSGRGNHATVNGTETVESEFDGAQLFNTTPAFDRVEVDDPFDGLPGPREILSESGPFVFVAPQPYSLVFHLNASVHGRDVLAFWGDEADNASFGFRLAQSGETIDGTTLTTDGVAAFFYPETNGVVCETGSIADNETHRLIVTHDSRGPANWRFYLDGDLTCTVPGESLIPNIGNATGFRLGPHPSAVDPFGSNVTIDEFHFYTREVTEFEAGGFEPFPQVEPFAILPQPEPEGARTLLDAVLPGLVLITVIPTVFTWLAWWGYNEFRQAGGLKPREFPLVTFGRRLEQRIRTRLRR